jgi:hypothetical protein
MRTESQSLKHKTERKMSKRKTEIKMGKIGRKGSTQKGKYRTKLISSRKGKEDRLCC